ncbi:MAG: AAA family ATPase [Candidatus Poseidoniaceae archaeon]|jgi:dephospho-CoA kinase|nr:AAA family ATPase [Candidatus Poseidoniaceae archaeon]
MGLVIAVCGMPASGKGEFAKILASRGVPVCSMGDLVREEVKHLGLEEGPNVFGQVASELRAEYGDDVLAKRLISEIDNKLTEASIVLIEGLRGTAEKEVFKAHWGESFLTVAITASTEVRFQRVLSRNRSEDGDLISFNQRDERERGWGLGKLIDQSDIVIANNDNIGDFNQEVSRWLDTL